MGRGSDERNLLRRHMGKQTEYLKAVARERNQARVEAADLRAQLERERMRYGRQLAANGAWMQLAAHLARNGQQELAQRYKQKADEAAARVRLEDFVVAHVNKGAE